MASAPESMGAPTSFTARRPHASNLPSFELPPPPNLSTLQTKYTGGFPHLNGSQLATPASSLTSVGNLLTPPSNASSESLSPAPGVTSAGSHTAPTSYTPNNSSGMWPPPATTAPYTYQSSQSPASFGQSRTLFSPSLNSVIRSSSSPSAPADNLPAPTYEMPHYQTSSLSMSSSSLPSLHAHQHSQHHHSMVGGPAAHYSTSASQSPSVAQDAYARQPPTPTYFSGSQPPAPSQHQHHSSYSYSATSPSQQSPLSGGGMKMSPINGGASSVPPLQPHFSRGYTYPLPGPVLSNVNNPGGQLQVVGGLPHGMVPAFNSGHAAHLQMYGHHPGSQHGQPMHLNQQTDRPFRCDQCPQSFNRNHDLKRHKRIHLAVKPFPCGHCDKSFSRKDALKRHVLVKGCGKASGNADGKELDASSSPSSHSDSVHGSPVVPAVV